MLQILTLVAACSPPPAGVTASVPPPGSTLPSNAKLVLLGGPPPQITITQLDVVYPLDLQQEHGIMWVDVGALGLTGTVTLSAEPLTAEFVIDPEADTEPPVFEGIDSIVSRYGNSSSDCSPPAETFTVWANIAPASDDWGRSYYELYEVLEDDALRWVGSTHHYYEGLMGISTTIPGSEEGTHCFVAYAYDVAGNSTPSGASGGACVDLVRPPPDAGVADSGYGAPLPLDGGVYDSGAKADSGTGGNLELEEGGCGCAATPRDDSSGFLTPLLLLVFLGRLVRSRAEPLGEDA